MRVAADGDASPSGKGKHEIVDLDNDGWDDAASMSNPKYRITWCRLVFSLVTFEWMKWGDEYAGSLRDQTVQELTNIALVSALVLTIWSTFLAFTGKIDWPDDAAGDDAPMMSDGGADAGGAHGGDGGGGFPFRETYAIAWGAAVVSCFMSLLSTIVLLLAVNELPSERYVRMLLETMGDATMFPTHCWIVSMICGFFGQLIFVRVYYGYHLSVRRVVPAFI